MRQKAGGFVENAKEAALPAEPGPRTLFPMDPKPEESISLRALYPHLTEEELQIAEENIARLVLVLTRMTERLCREQNPKSSPAFDETERQL